MSSSVAPTAQQPNIYRDPSIPPPHPPLSFEIHQQRPLHLLNLPIEVLHQILTSLSHPISDFLSLRLVSRHISSFITSHPALRHFILSTLPSRHPALRELSVLPPEIWSFNLLHDGWLRALLAIKRTIHEPWLKSERDLHESDWLVYFKEMLSEGVYGVGVRHEHSIIRFLGSNGTVECIGGMPLASREWRVEDGVMKVTGYPHNVPGRDPRTLARKMEHVTVAMISDSPEFLEAMRKVDQEVLEKACNDGIIGREEAERRKIEFQKAWEAVDWSPEARRERLKGWLNLRNNDGGEKGNSEGSSVALGTGWVQLLMAGYGRGAGGQFLPVIAQSGGHPGSNHHHTAGSSLASTDEEGDYDDVSDDSEESEEQGE